MKKVIIGAVFAALLLQGCGHINWSTALSIGVDIAQLRADREAAGEGHIEDVFVDKTETESE